MGKEIIDKEVIVSEAEELALVEKQLDEEIEALDNIPGYDYSTEEIVFEAKLMKLQIKELDRISKLPDTDSDLVELYVDKIKTLKQQRSTLLLASILG